MKENQIDFDISREAQGLIFAIIDRAFESPAAACLDKTSLVMDLTACHANGCKLKLVEMLKADMGDLMHDVCGIRANINRVTGKIENCFLPRFAE